MAPVKYSTQSSQKFWVTLARGSHPFPSRTRKLSPSAPMVLHAQVCGRVGRRPIKSRKTPVERLGFFVLCLSVRPEFASLSSPRPGRGTPTKVTLSCVPPYSATFVGTGSVPTKLSRGPHRQLRPQLWSGTTRVAIFMPAGVPWR